MLGSGVKNVPMSREQLHNNNLHERLNGKFKDRIKTVRGFKSEDPALIHLMMIHHNFFRSHSGIGNITPAEKAGIRIQGSDKWMTFICNAAIHVYRERKVRDQNAEFL